MKVAVFGSEGQLGHDVCGALSEHTIITVPHERADVTDDEAVYRIVDGIRADWVINCAAMTDVERCESDPIPAFQVNAVGARNIARACDASEARLVQISTDYVFDGTKETPYVESDPPNPLNVYGMSKLAGEYFARNECKESYVLRTSGLYGVHECRGKGTNFVETMLRLARDCSSLRVVGDELLTPTYTVDLAEQIRVILEMSPAPAVYHATNRGSCSWFDFAQEIFHIEDVSIEIENITGEEWGSVARRPHRSTLENAELERAGLNTLPDWRDALARYLEERREQP